MQPLKENNPKQIELAQKNFYMQGTTLSMHAALVHLDEISWMLTPFLNDVCLDCLFWVL